MGDPGSAPGLGRSPGGGPGNPLQYSYLENSMDRRAWWATVHEVTKEMDNNNNNLKLPIQQSSLCHQVYACMCVCVSTCDLTVVVQLLSCVQLFATPWTVACSASLSFTISRSLLRFMTGESVMLSYYLILCHPVLLFPSISISQ